MADSFTGPAEEHVFSGVLFDMDGTIIDSTDAIIKHWHKLGKELGVDPNAILATSHGRRSIDTLKEYDVSKANWEYISHIEGLIPKEYGADAVEIPGSRALLDVLSEANAPWAIVTSGTRALMDGWLERMKLAYPKHSVVAEDVKKGKPDPQCYLLGKERLGLGPEEAVLVVEDAPAGIKAGRAAGCRVLGLVTTHTVEQVKAAGADWIVKDLRSLKFLGRDEAGKLRLEISSTLES